MGIPTFFEVSIYTLLPERSRVQERFEDKTELMTVRFAKFYQNGINQYLKNGMIESHKRRFWRI